MKIFNLFIFCLLFFSNLLIAQNGIKTSNDGRVNAIFGTSGVIPHNDGPNGGWTTSNAHWGKPLMYSSKREPNDGSGAFPFNEYGEFIIQGNSHGAQYNKGISFFTWDGGASSLPKFRMRILGAGNVGIGSSNPTTKLYVEDDLNAHIRAYNNQSSGKSIVDAGKSDVGHVGMIANLSGSGNYGIPNGNVGVFSTHSDLVFGTGFNQTDGTEKMRITKSGNIGIGTNDPSSALTLKGTIGNNVLSALHFDNNKKLFTINTSAQYPYMNFYSTDGSTIKIKLNTNGTTYFTGGKVAIGTTVTTNGNYKLYVKDGIRTEKVKVDVSSNWADFVFEEDYQLRSLEEVESFVKENKHLPEIPSASEVEEEGIDLGTMDAKLLQKIEELTLYMIEQGKRMKALEKQNEKISEENKKLKALILSK